VFVTDRGLLKVGDFGTSRFLEIAAHGTTVIGSPPYMAPEQFEGRAVFASDLYSLGVTMYQMLTGVLPYEMPAPSDFEKLKRGELVSPPRLKNPTIPRAIDDIVMRALSAEVGPRYQRAEDLLNDLLAARRDLVRRPAADKPSGAAPVAFGRLPVGVSHARAEHTVQEAASALSVEARRPMRSRVRTREIAASRFCWNCRKPLPAKAHRCPFCSETQ
jgi:serine/threonine protein kinase